MTAKKGDKMGGGGGGGDRDKLAATKGKLPKLSMRANHATRGRHSES